MSRRNLLKNMEKTAFNATTFAAVKPLVNWVGRQGTNLLGAWRSLNPFEKLTLGLSALPVIPMLWPDGDDKKASRYAHGMDKQAHSLFRRLNKTAMFNYTQLPNVTALPNMHMSPPPTPNMNPGMINPMANAMPKQASIPASLTTLFNSARNAWRNMPAQDRVNLGFQGLFALPTIKSMIPEGKKEEEPRRAPGTYEFKQASELFEQLNKTARFSGVGNTLRGVKNAWKAMPYDSKLNTVNSAANTALMGVQTMPVLKEMMQKKPTDKVEDASAKFQYKQASQQEKTAWVQIPLALARMAPMAIRGISALTRGANNASKLKNVGHAMDAASMLKVPEPPKPAANPQQQKLANFKKKTIWKNRRLFLI